jgi:hypothetical protein
VADAQPSSNFTKRYIISTLLRKVKLSEVRSHFGHRVGLLVGFLIIRCLYKSKSKPK